ncbi:MAG: hypothetical protein V4760_03480 [Bdellovibrionota bacterium]
MFHRAFAIVTIVALALCSVIASGATDASNPVRLEDYLVEFHKDPKRVMNAPLAKFDSKGRRLKVDQNPIGSFDAKDEARFRDRLELREKICMDSSGRPCPKPRDSRFAAPTEANQINSFVYNPNVNKNLISMEQAGQVQAAVPNAPWSDSYWPMKFGLLGRRWMDKKFPSSDVWLDNYNYYLAHPTSSLPVNQLSPAEKYDLLMGDGGLSLTTSQWGSGKFHQDKKGSVPSWAGLCHGWSPASIMVPTPQKTVNAIAPNGQTIPFYPSDIKALAALSWGEASPRKRFVGTRCETAHPKEDEVGRVVNEGCFDVNPGTWHMAVVHQISTMKRSFVMDATYDLQVWNYPVYSYKYTYFNPQTLATSTTLAGAAVKTTDFTIDKFRTYRSPLAKYVVGIAMDVAYSTPTQPSVKPIPVPLFHTVKYVYDLEIDESGTILGGEWYSNFHPDFLWNPLPDSHPLSTGELVMPVPVPWDGNGVVPPELRQAASLSSRRGQPVSVVVEALVQRSIAP